MRRQAVVELVVVGAALTALAAGILAASLLLLWRCRRAANKQAPQLPPAAVASERPIRSPKEPARRRSALWRALLRLLLCSRRHLTRVEPADSTAATQGEEGEQAGPKEEVATWRDRWFWPTTAAASRALYTINEESVGGSESEQEPPPRPGSAVAATRRRRSRKPPCEGEASSSCSSTST